MIMSAYSNDSLKHLSDCIPHCNFGGSPSYLIILTCRAVYPFPSVLLRSAPHRMSVSNDSSWLQSTALWMGAWPSRSCMSGWLPLDTSWNIKKCVTQSFGKTVLVIYHRQHFHPCPHSQAYTQTLFLTQTIHYCMCNLNAHLVGISLLSRPHPLLVFHCCHI